MGLLFDLLLNLKYEKRKFIEKDDTFPYIIRDSFFISNIQGEIAK